MTTETSPKNKRARVLKGNFIGEVVEVVKAEFGTGAPSGWYTCVTDEGQRILLAGEELEMLAETGPEEKSPEKRWEEVARQVVDDWRGDRRENQEFAFKHLNEFIREALASAHAAGFTEGRANGLQLATTRGVHSCSDACQRPNCQNRRIADAARSFCEDPANNVKFDALERALQPAQAGEGGCK